MATAAAGVRVSDPISLGVIAQAFPPDRAAQVLAKTGRASERDLPAQVMVCSPSPWPRAWASSTREALRCLLADAEPLCRLVTTILDPAQAPAADLAALCHERWKIEGAPAELKTHLRGAQAVLRSKVAALARQELRGLLLAHFAVRRFVHEAALRADEDPDRLSFLRAARVVRRKLPLLAAFPFLGAGTPCTMRCWKSAWQAPAAGRCRAGSSAR